METASSLPNPQAAARPLLSICMIVKNEEAVLERALASAAGMGAELIVVDTGSTDRTVEIALAAGAKVHHFAWIDDFSAARNFAFAQASGVWMLVLDADEELKPELRANVTRLLTTTTAAALRVPVVCLNDQGNVQMTMMSARIVRNGFGYGYEGRVHEIMTANIMRAGGRIDDTNDLPLVHHGYTSAESARKDRQARNRKLLEASHRAAPDDPRYWHYLGLELRVQGDLEGAASFFDRMLVKAPNHELAAWSASCLGSIHEVERDYGAAWHTTTTGLKGLVGRINCLVQLGKLALREGDADTARWCADELDRSPGDDFTDRTAGIERATEIRAAAQVEKGCTPKVRDFLLAAVKKYPRNTVLAELLVKVCESLGGRGKGAIDAVKRSNNSSSVLSAAMTAYFHGGAFAQCVEMGEKSGVHNEMWAFALAKVGRKELAREELLTFGDNIAGHAIVFGLAYEDEAAIEHGLSASTPSHREALSRVRAGGKVPIKLTWVITSWLELAVSLHEERAADMLAAALPWSIAEREAFRALVAYDGGDAMGALQRALAHTDEMASLEVIGLVAHAHGDFPAAAAMLSMRAKAGDASVRVYLKGAEALARLGKHHEAEQMIAMGREARPASKALLAASYAPSVSRATKNAKKPAHHAFR